MKQPLILVLLLFNPKQHVFFGGFLVAQIAQVYGIKRLLPEKLQIVLVSATLPDEAVNPGIHWESGENHKI